MARYKCFTAVDKVLHAPGEGGVWETIWQFAKGEESEDHAWRRTYYFDFLLRI